MALARFVQAANIDSVFRRVLRKSLARLLGRLQMLVPFALLHAHRVLLVENAWVYRSQGRSDRAGSIDRLRFRRSARFNQRLQNTWLDMPVYVVRQSLKH